MSQTADNPGDTCLHSMVAHKTEHDVGDGLKDCMIEKLLLALDDLWTNSIEENQVVVLITGTHRTHTISFEHYQGNRLRNCIFEKSLFWDIWNNSADDQKNSTEEKMKEKNCGPHSLLAYSLLLSFLLFPSLSENKKYEERVDYHQSCNIQASALSKISPVTMQTLEVKIVSRKNLKILNTNIF